MLIHICQTRKLTSPDPISWSEPKINYLWTLESTLSKSNYKEKCEMDERNCSGSTWARLYNKIDYRRAHNWVLKAPYLIQIPLNARLLWVWNHSSTVIVGSVVESSLCDSTWEGNAITRPLWARGGRYLGCFFGCPFQGRKTPVPPQGRLLGFIVIGCIGVSMTTGAPNNPHLGIMSIAS